MKLNINVTFTRGRFHGQEFPPSPLRLFQAMLAGSHRGVYGLINTEVRDAAFTWLEQLSPPTIEASEHAETDSDVINYVPNNDNAISHNRTAKPMRAFVLIGEKLVRYVWHFADTDEDKLNAAVVCAIAQLVTCLGHGVDEVFARGTINEEAEAKSDAGEAVDIYEPNIVAGGEWQAPRQGSYQGFKSRYENVLREANRDFRPDAENYPVPMQQVTYNSSKYINLDAPLALFMMKRIDESGKRKDTDKRKDFDARDLRQPGAMVRHAVKEWKARAPLFAEHYGEAMFSRLAFGHEPCEHESGETATQYNGAHISYVPLPSINRDSVADGRIRRMLLVGNGCEDETARRFFFDLAANLNGAILKDNDTPCAYLERVENLSSDSILPLYNGNSNNSRVWRSVTPIVLTGMTRRGREPEQLIIRALKQIGLSENDVESVATYKSPIVPKTFRPLDYNLNGHLESTPRFHAEIIFKRPVKGVLVVGRGRNYGFGLMKPRTF